MLQSMHETSSPTQSCENKSSLASTRFSTWLYMQFCAQCERRRNLGYLAQVRHGDGPYSPMSSTGRLVGWVATLQDTHARLLGGVVVGISCHR